MELLKQRVALEAGVDGNGWGWAKMLLLNAWASPRGPALAKLVISHHEILLSSEG